MKILLAVPSKNRVDTLKDNTYRWLSGLNADWRVFVEPQDRPMYTQNGIENLIDIGENNRGLGFAKSQIKKYAIENGYNLVFKIDDDVKNFTGFREKIDTTKVLNELIPFFVETFENKPKLGAIGFPYSFLMFKDQEWEAVKKMQSCYIIRTNFLVNEKYDFTVFEDFAVGIDLLLNNYKILKYNWLGQELGVPVGKGTGGHQDFNRAEQALKDADLLRKLYPPINFKKVDKPWRIEPDMKSIKL